MNFPNALTLSRIFFAAVMVILLEENSLMGNISAVIVFAVATITDFYDGYLAKTWGMVSDFGKIMDPVADKILMLSIFGVLAHIGQLPWWMFVVIAIREIGVTISRFWAMSHGQILAAERAGKVKTVVQMIAVSAILLYLVARQCADWFASVDHIWVLVNNSLMVLAVVLTVYSGMDYFRNQSRS